LPRRLPRTRRGLLSLLAGLVVVALVGTATPAVLQRNDAAPESASAPLVRAADVPLTRGGDGLRLDDPSKLPLVAVDRIVDGDTLDVGAGDSKQRVRVFGIAAPERDERCGPEATEELRNLAGSQVRFVADARLEDRYGRELRYLFTPDGRSIDAMLVSEGAVEAWHEDGAYRDALGTLEREARAAGRGCLWRARESGVG